MLNETKLHDNYGGFKVLGENSDRIPLVSVVMSAYNTPEEFLTKSIESVLDQSYENFEFIIINDGADQETSNILISYVEKDSRIKLIIQNNMGLTKSLNRGIMFAKGKYVARQDTDDLWMKNKLKKQIEAINKEKNIVLVGTLCQILNEKFKNISETIPGYAERLNIKDTKDIREALIQFNPFCHASILIDKEIVEKLGYYNDDYRYSQDYELWVRVLKDYKASIISEFLTQKIFHSNSITGGEKRKKQRLLGMKARSEAMKNFNSSLKDKIKLKVKYTVIYLFPESIISLIQNFKQIRKN